MFIVACVVGFVGPFGTYLEGDLIHRIGHWASFLAGAYVVVRPAIALGHLLARKTLLPRAHIGVWVVILSSFPLSLLWIWGSAAIFDSAIGYAVMLPFSLICAVAVLVVVWWAERIDQRYRAHGEGHGIAAGPRHSPALVSEAPEEAQAPEAAAGAVPQPAQPRLFERLSAGFSGPVLALQGEDHYVRVHGAGGRDGLAAGSAELVLMRLRDAIAEMDGAAGEQVHRSWWVAREAVAGTERQGRMIAIRLVNGLLIPVARASVERLRAGGYLPG